MIKPTFLFSLCLLVLVCPSWQYIDYLDQDSWSGTCSSGTEQSPVLIPESTDAECGENLMYLEFSCSSDTSEDGGQLGDYTGFTVSTVDTNIYSVVTTGFCKATAMHMNQEVTEYSQTNYHVHIKSEHRFEDDSGTTTRPDMELHLVMSATSASSDRVLQLGVYFNENTSIDGLENDSEIVKTIHNAYVSDDSDGTDETMSPLAGIVSLFASGEYAYIYDGSLAFSPCTEDYGQTMKKTQMDISSEALEDIMAAYLEVDETQDSGYIYNARDVQDLNDRNIFCVEFTTVESEGEFFDSGTGFISSISNAALVAMSLSLFFR